jgi:hypothetical protein
MLPHQSQFSFHPDEELYCGCCVMAAATEFLNVSGLPRNAHFHPGYALLRPGKNSYDKIFGRRQIHLRGRRSRGGKCHGSSLLVIFKVISGRENLHETGVLLRRNVPEFK